MIQTLTPLKGRPKAVRIMKYCDTAEEVKTHYLALKTIGEEIGPGFKRREVITNNHKAPFIASLLVKWAHKDLLDSLIGLGYKVKWTKVPRGLEHKNW